MSISWLGGKSKSESSSGISLPALTCSRTLALFVFFFHSSLSGLGPLLKILLANIKIQLTYLCWLATLPWQLFKCLVKLLWKLWLIVQTRTLITKSRLLLWVRFKSYLKYNFYIFIAFKGCRQKKLKKIGGGHQRLGTFPKYFHFLLFWQLP